MATAAKKAPKKSTAPANETKAQKFSRLATKRVTKALKAVGNIGNLSGAGYESTAEQRAKIVTALQEAVDGVKSRLEGTKAAGATFTV